MILLIIAIFIIILVYDYYYEYNEHFTYSNDDFVEAFSSVKNMMSDINIYYAIMFGTALGAYRSNDFITHDDDIDIVIFHDDLVKIGHKTLKQQQLYFNTIAKKYGLIPKNNKSAPYMYVDEYNRAMPIMYQYLHEKTNMGVDFYIAYKYTNNYWIFCDGGEYDFKGYKYPIRNTFYKTKLNIYNDVNSCPVEYLRISYGPNFHAPLKKDENGYYTQKREYFGPFLDEWLLPLN